MFFTDQNGDAASRSSFTSAEEVKIQFHRCFPLARLPSRLSVTKQVALRCRQHMLCFPSREPCAECAFCSAEHMLISEHQFACRSNASAYSTAKGSHLQLACQQQGLILARCAHFSQLRRSCNSHYVLLCDISNRCTADARDPTPTTSIAKPAKRIPGISSRVLALLQQSGTSPEALAELAGISMCPLMAGASRGLHSSCFCVLQYCNCLSVQQSTRAVLKLSAVNLHERRRHFSRSKLLLFKPAAKLYPVFHALTLVQFQSFQRSICVCAQGV